MAARSANHSTVLIRLIQDQYGKFVIQDALMFCVPNHKAELTQFIVQRVIGLSQQKYASNVVESCLMNAGQQMIDFALLCICSLNLRALKALCIDAYANYVVQKLIESGNPEFIANLYGRLNPHSKEIRRRHVGGGHIVKLLKQKIQNAQS